MWPVKGKILSTFSQSDTSRKGIDISSNLGAPVYASNNGTVVYSGDGLRGYGELIIIKHSNNLLSAYAHNANRLVKEGQVVKQGQKIANSGKGTDGRPLLHFEIRKNGQPVNPLLYLPKK
ncbi:MAG: peptidoglycan DD-metalloendopeptidase family protein [Alcanivoracaceae bacterium]|nr:peptidoglycan DD-metalloendopeptidase family protein [Alcanivoracaceae bacterium]